MVGVAFLVSAGAAFLGVIGAVRQAVKLPPAEAMRPEPPAEFKAFVAEQVRFYAELVRLAKIERQ